MVTILDCAMLSEDVYSMRNGVTELTDRRSDKSWECKRSIVDSASGFGAAVFTRYNDAVIAFRGTDLDPKTRAKDIEVRHRIAQGVTGVLGSFHGGNLPEVIVRGGLVVGKALLPDPATWPYMSHWVRLVNGEHEQIRLARNLIAELASDHDIYRSYLRGHPKPGLIVTGHSLGGGLAQLMVQKFHEPGLRRVVGVTFNAPGVSASRQAHLPCYNLLMDWDPINSVNSAPAMGMAVLGLKRALLAGVLGVENVGKVRRVLREEMPPEQASNISNHSLENLIEVLKTTLKDEGARRVRSLFSVSLAETLSPWAALRRPTGA